MPQILRIKVRVAGKDIFFRVLEQSHRGKAFGDKGTFHASNGVDLCSDKYPELRLYNEVPMAFVRGEAAQIDYEETPFRTFNDMEDCLRAFKKVYEAVIEYNDDKTINPVDYDGPELPK